MTGGGGGGGGGCTDRKPRPIEFIKKEFSFASISR
jgi:hypothetical protein